MTKKLLSRALQIANLERQTHPEYRHYLHWTFIVLANGRILDWATNRAVEPPRQFGYHAVSKLHSELAAYRKTYPKGQWQAINVRLSRRGEIRMAMPCPTCATWMAAVGCEAVWFTTPMGWSRCRLAS